MLTLVSCQSHSPSRDGSLGWGGGRGDRAAGESVVEIGRAGTTHLALLACQILTCTDQM